MRIAVLGVSDTIGDGLVSGLLARGHSVRAIESEQTSIRRGDLDASETRLGRFDDSGFLREAFEGANAVFVRLPVDHNTKDLRQIQAVFGGAIVTALAVSGVKKIVNLSAMGADLPGGTGPLVGYFDQEERLNRLSEADVLHLRPAWLMDNLIASIPEIERSGEVASLLRSDLRFQMVAARDIADVAAEWLSEPEFEEKSELYVFGPDKVSMNDATAILQGALPRKHLSYRQLGDKEGLDRFMAEGKSEEAGLLHLELYSAMNKGLMAEPGGAFTRGPTTLSEFLTRFAVIH